MGYTTVAVLYNDCVHEMEADTGRIGRQMTRAINAWTSRKHRPYELDFYVGKVIAMDHASGTQVVLVKHGTGSSIHEAGPDQSAIWQMQDYLQRHGYKVTKPRKPRKPQAEVAP